MERHSESVASRGPRAPSLCLETVLEPLLTGVIKNQIVGPKTFSAIQER